MSDCPALKPIKGFLARAAELDRSDPLMAFYCRQYAVQVGIEIHGKEQDKESKKQVSQTLRELMARLESDKAAVASLPGYADDAAYVEGIALRVFDAADSEDRAGRASKRTAQNFYVANTFFDVMKLFGDTPEDIQQKSKYAQWKAVEILKALKAGQRPRPGPPGWTPEDDQPAAADPAPPSASVPDSAPAPAPAPASAPAATREAVQSVQPTPIPQATGGYTPSGADILEAQKLAKFAVSALNFQDVSTAVTNLTDALKRLTGQ